MGIPAFLNVSGVVFVQPTKHFRIVIEKAIGPIL